MTVLPFWLVRTRFDAALSQQAKEFSSQNRSLKNPWHLFIRLTLETFGLCIQSTEIQMNFSQSLSPRLCSLGELLPFHTTPENNERFLASGIHMQLAISGRAQRLGLITGSVSSSSALFCAKSGRKSSFNWLKYRARVCAACSCFAKSRQLKLSSFVRSFVWFYHSFVSDCANALGKIL